MLVLALIAVAGIGVAAIATAPWWVDRCMKSARSGPEHTFLLDEAPPFLNEAIALSKGQEALRLDGLGQSTWRPLRDGRSRAPDGSTDEFLVRNTQNANYGAIQFRSDDNRVRIVYVELRGNVIHARTWLPK